MNNPLRYTDPSGEVLGWDDAGEFIIGGFINLAMNASKIDNFYEGLGYFVTGGVSTWVTFQTFGAAATLGGAINGFGNSLLETNFLTEEKGYSFKSITDKQWGTIVKKTTISTVSGFAGGWAGKKISSGITSKWNIESEFWNKAITGMATNGISSSLEAYGTSTWVNNNLWYSKKALGDFGIGLGLGVLTGFTQTFLVEKWAKPELNKLGNLIDNLNLNRSNFWNNLNRNFYNPLIPSLPSILPPLPGPFILPIINN